MNMNLICKQNSKVNDLMVSLTIFIVALVVRVIYFIQIKNLDIFKHLVLDSKFYHQIALKLLESNGSSELVLIHVHPFYVFFLNTVYSIFGVNVFYVYLLQIFLGSLTCLLICFIAKEVANRIVGFAAGMLAAFYLPFIFYDGQILPTCLATFLLVSFTYIFVITIKKNFSFFYVFVSGIIMGSLLLIRGNTLILIPLTVIYMLFNKISFSKRVFVILIFILGVIVLPTVNGFYNYTSAGKFSFLSLHKGEGFYIGNNPEATGTSKQPSFVDQNPFFEHESYRKKASSILGREVSISDSSDFWFKKGLEFIKQNPSKYSRLLLNKSFFLINSYEICDNNNYYFFKKFSSLLRMPFFSFVIISPLGLLGLIMVRKRFPNMSFLYLVVAGYSISLILLRVNARYRMQLVPYFIVFSAIALYLLCECFKNRKWRSLLVYSFLFVILFFVVNTAIKIDGWDLDGKIAVSHYNYGHILEGQNKIKLSEREYQKSIELYPKFVSAYMSLGRIYIKQGNYKKAIYSWEKVLEIMPDNKTATNYIDKYIDKIR